MSVKLTTPRTTVGLVNGSCFVRRHSDPSSEEQPGSSLDIGRPIDPIASLGSSPVRRCVHWPVASRMSRTEQAVVVHRSGLHLRFDPAATRDDVGYLLVVAAGEQSVVQRARHPNCHRVVAGAHVLCDVDDWR
jgi:hypothetical protein